MRRYFHSTLGLFLIIALLAPAAWAQSGQKKQRPRPQKPPKPKIKPNEVTTKDLDAASDILIAMRGLQARYMPQMKSAGSRKEAMKVRRKMAKEAHQIVKKNKDLESDRYRQIMLLARQDTTFRKRLTDRVKEKAPAPPQSKSPQKGQQ